MDILDNTECKFNVNSFKIVYVVNSEYYLYKRTALTKAREVGICLGIPSLGVHNAHSLLACSGVMSLEYLYPRSPKGEGGYTVLPLSVHPRNLLSHFSQSLLMAEI